MVIRIVRTVLVCAGVLILGSCDVIFGSVFPATLSLAKAQADLSKLIPAGNNGSTYLRLVETGGYGYVIVTGSPSSNVYFAYIYDLDLNLMKSLAGTTAPVGDGVMVDASGNIAVGNELLKPDLSQVNVNTVAQVYAQVSSGLDGFVTGGRNVIGVSVDPTSSNLLTYTHYDGIWAVGGATPTPLPALSSNTFGLQVNAVFDDGVSGGNVVMVISQGTPSGNNGNAVTGHFVTIPKGNFLTVITSNLLDSSPQRDNLDAYSFGYANGSIFAYDTKSASLVRIDPATGSTRDSFPLNSSNKSQVKYAYRLSGGTFYSFDTDSRILTKYVAWW